MHVSWLVIYRIVDDGFILTMFVLFSLKLQYVMISGRMNEMLAYLGEGEKTVCMSSCKLKMHEFMQTQNEKWLWIRVFRV